MIVAYILMADLWRLVEPAKNKGGMLCAHCDQVIAADIECVLQACRLHAHFWYLHELCFRIQAQKAYLVAMHIQPEVARHVHN